MQIIIPVKNSFDGTTPLPANASLKMVANGVYKITAAGGGGNLENVGQVSLDTLLHLDNKVLNYQAAVYQAISHNGGAGVTLFEAQMLLRTAAGGVTDGSPRRRVNPNSGAGNGGNAGTLAALGPGDILQLSSNGIGDQEVVLNVVPVPDTQIVDVTGRAFQNDLGNWNAYVFGVPIGDILTASAYVGRLVWNGPTIEVSNLRLVASATIASDSLVVVASINGTPLDPGTLTLAVGKTAGEAAEAAPLSDNVLQSGDVLEFSVTGGGNTAAGHGMVTVHGNVLVRDA